MSAGTASSKRQLLAQALASALEQFNAGRWPEAEAYARAALRLAPGDPRALNVLAGAAMESGHHEEAIPLFKRAAAAEPKSPFLHFNLGEAYRRTQAYAKALPSFRRAAALKPDFAEAIALAGESLHRIGREDEAERHFRRALALAPALPSALHGLGLLLLDRGAPGPAAECLSRGLAATSPDHSLRPSLLANLGSAHLQLGDGLRGLQALAEAVQAAPDNDNLWRFLATSLKDTSTAPDGVDFRTILQRLFDRPDVNPRDLATAAVAILEKDEEIAQLLRDIDTNPGEVHAIVEKYSATAARLVEDPLFRRLLVNAPVPNSSIELFLVQLRSDLLALLENSPESRPAELELAICLARQSFLNEYVHHVTPAEDLRVDRLAQALDRDDLCRRSGDATCVAIVASYRPLIQTRLARRLAPRFFPELSDLLREQLEEPSHEAEIRASLPLLKPTLDPTSLAVQQQYEDSPYPRWTRCSVAEPLPFQAAVNRALPHLPSKETPDLAKPRILIAGCGTGLETMRVVNSYQSASILAIDLSAASLAYGVRKAREYGISNVEHLQADILDLPVLTERFDLIESFGVLHHMEDPGAGLAVLAGLLKPKGLLSIGLYSEIGRQAVVEARRHIAHEGYEADLGGIRQLRRELMTHKRPGLNAVISPASDFWTTSDCRDLLFHVNEHRFTLLEIGDMLKMAGLEFLGVEFSHSSDRIRFLAEHPQAGAIQDVKVLHLHETDHPELFGDTYRIWSRRSLRGLKRKN